MQGMRFQIMWQYLYCCKLFLVISRYCPYTWALSMRVAWKGPSHFHLMSQMIIVVPSFSLYHSQLKIQHCMKPPLFPFATFQGPLLISSFCGLVTVTSFCLISVLFWDIMRRCVVIVYRPFQTTYQSHFQGDILTLEDGTDTLSRDFGKQWSHDAT
jgi:hypothetical protein